MAIQQIAYVAARTYKADDQVNNIYQRLGLPLTIEEYRKRAHDLLSVSDHVVPHHEDKWQELQELLVLSRDWEPLAKLGVEYAKRLLEEDESKHQRPLVRLTKLLWNVDALVLSEKVRTQHAQQKNSLVH